MPNWRSRDWSQLRTLLTALIWALIPSGIAVLVAPKITDVELRKVVYAGAATLFFGGFLGGNAEGSAGRNRRGKAQA